MDDVKRLEMQRPRTPRRKELGMVGGPAAFEVAWAEGNTMTLEQAIEYALEPGSLARPEA